MRIYRAWFAVAAGLLLVGVVLGSASMSRGEDAPPDAAPQKVRTPETWPTWHVTALPDEGAWMPGDANGCIYWKGKYHLMYIYQDARLPKGGHCWGHLSSSDLVNWTYHPPTLVPGPNDPEKGIFSGNAFINKDGRPMLCWIGIDAGVCVATAEDDDLIRWKKHPNNPIIPLDKTNAVRVWDPYLWLEGDTYVCLLGANRHKDRDTLYTMKSTDLLHWEKVGPFFEGDPAWRRADEDCSCPDFFKLGNRHVLICISHAFGARAYIGQFDARQLKFVPERHVRMNWLGGMFFAPESLEDGKGRRIFWAWVNDPRLGAVQRRDGAGYQSMPRILELDADGAPRILPVPELVALRKNHRHHSEQVLKPGVEAPLADIRGDSLELGLEIKPNGAEECGLKVRCSPDGQEETTIIYNRKEKTLCIDMAKASLRDDITYASPPGMSFYFNKTTDNKQPFTSVTAPLELRPGEPLRLRVFIDKAILEVFANDRQCLTEVIYPRRSDSQEIRLFARGGAATLSQLDAWDMAPAKFVNQKQAAVPKR